jgi:hypothetical protein
MMKPNKDWHLTHRMPENPTLEQRVAWHLEHAEKCGCREIPANLKNKIAILKRSKPIGKQ